MSSGEFKARLRGEILRLIYRQDESGRYRYDDVTLAGVLVRLGHDTYVREVRMLLQDLQERGCIALRTDKNPLTGEVRVSEIEIRPRGRDVIEGRERDPAIFLLDEE
jgi:hypothetical protein